MNSQIQTADFNDRPFLAIWEMTQACDLACVHCRAAAQPLCHPMELTTDEGTDLIDQIEAMNVPDFVLTGGDPIKRPHLFELMAHVRKVFAGQTKQFFRYRLTPPSAAPTLRNWMTLQNWLRASALPCGASFFSYPPVAES